MKFSFLIFILLAITVYSSCSNKPGTPEPPNLRPGEDACDECRMIINEKRFAAAYVTEDGDAKRFDDIGCMLLYKNKMSPEGATYWVNNFTNSVWLNADDALFVMSKEINTPMAYGIIAVTGKKEAGSITKSFKAKVLNFKELQKEFKQTELSN